MKYFGGCDVGSTYTKAVILDENGKMLADTTIKSKINAALSAEAAMNEVVAKVPELKGDVKNLTYLVGTGYGRNKVATADENISEISCHAMGVHERQGNHRYRRTRHQGYRNRYGRHCQELRNERQVRGRYGTFLRSNGKIV